ncbi:Fungal lipase-like domain containing protein [Trema orientale]|uniref:Phospholipase A1 n=1 Tax=Trema orientale TaxID=63057 RepID=A0A2P5FFC9_TREOI|nr:Fungal lipase-like domain containing protein [Trema orientale]
MATGLVLTPTKKSNDVVPPSWEELLGSKNWEGLLEPSLELSLREFILRCGNFAEAAYDCFNSNTISPHCGNSRYGKNTFFNDVVLQNASSYQVVSFLYATSGIGDTRKNFFKHPDAALGEFAWDRESNWMGYVAVTNDKVSKANGRREIYVAWRGTVVGSEWISNIFGAERTSAKPLLAPRLLEGQQYFSLWGKDEPFVHEGWLSIYTSDNAGSEYVKTSARVQLHTVIQELVNKYKEEKLSVVVTGHSLGGALATLSAFDLVENYVVGRDVLVAAFVFGCPQVGNTAFKERVAEHSNLKILHVKNVRDMVPRLPDWNLWFYVPVETSELEIDTNKSPYLETKHTVDYALNWHNLEVNLHVVASWNGADKAFEPKVKRSLALVNKSTRYLKDELNVPESWWVERNNGMVFDEDSGDWVLDPPPPADQMIRTALK